MLQTSAIHPSTLAALKKLMSIPSLQSFYLVGGTALALVKGHRLSVDVDLFSANIPFDAEESETPIVLKGNVSWEMVKITIEKHIKMLL